MNEQPFEPERKAPENREKRKGDEPQLVFPVPRGMVYGSVAVVIFSLIVTFFVRNPYTQSVSEGSDYYESSIERNLALWVLIFIGIPASFLAYKHWILPMLERRANQRR